MFVFVFVFVLHADPGFQKLLSFEASIEIDKEGGSYLKRGCPAPPGHPGPIPIRHSVHTRHNSAGKTMQFSGVDTVSTLQLQL